MAQALTKEKFIENHSAFFQQLGFDHQFAGCMFYLLGLALEDRLVYERDDDFVIYRKAERATIKEYYQVKHTSDANKKLTDSDSDFWKTIDNWHSLYNLSNPEEKSSFFTDGRFVIITNKEPDNFLYTKIEKLRNGSIGIDEILHDIDEKLKGQPSYSETLYKLKSLGPTTLNEFMHKVEIKYLEDFIKNMYQHFLDLYKAPTKSDQIVIQLTGELFKHKLECNNKFEFTGATFKQKYKHLFELVTDEYLTLEGFHAEGYAPSQPYQKMPIVQQLQNIGVIETPVNIEEYEFNLYMQKFRRFMSAFLSYQRTQLITSRLEEKLNDAAFNKWHTIFRQETIRLNTKKRRRLDITAEEKIEAGQKVFYKVLDTNIPVFGYKTDMDFSNGWYLYMSNSWKVVWHYDWYESLKYKK